MLIESLGKRADLAIARFASRLPNPHSVDQVLRYFGTGKLPLGVDLKPEWPQVVSPRVIEIDEGRLLVSAVRRSTLLGMPEAYVGFIGLDRLPGRSPPIELANIDPRAVYGGLGYTFTSLASFSENMAYFAETVRSGRVTNPNRGELLAEEWLTLNR